MFKITFKLEKLCLHGFNQSPMADKIRIIHAQHAQLCLDREILNDQGEIDSSTGFEDDFLRGSQLMAIEETLYFVYTIFLPNVGSQTSD